MRRKADGPPDSEGEESPRARSESPAWGNPTSRVRKQAVSFVSQAASLLLGTWEHVPEPRGFRIASQPDACKRAERYADALKGLPNQRGEPYTDLGLKRMKLQRLASGEIVPL